MLSLKHFYKAAAKIILIIACLIAGFYVRTERIFEWESNPDLYFVMGEPSFMDPDGYYYLQTAKEIINKTYTPIDNKRAYPSTTAPSPSPSLLALSLAYFSKFTMISLNWVAIFTPVFLGLLIVFPLYLFSISWGSFAAAAGSIIIGILSHAYSSRTSLGRIDTDCLNVVIPLLCAYLFMRFGIVTTTKRYVYFAGGIFFYLLFLWWWDMSPAAVSVLSLSPLLLALLFHYRPRRKEGLWFYGVLLFLVCVVCYILGFSVISQYFQSIFGHLLYISKHEEGLFPNIGISIEEQRSHPLITIAKFAIPGLVSLVFAVCGMILLVVKKFRFSLYLLPLLIIGSFGVLYAERFLMFLTPVLAIGFGYFFHEVLSTAKNRPLPVFLYAIFLCYITISTVFKDRLPPSFFPGQTIQGMLAIKNITPENAVIWSWWDEGHPLVYWAERATISDGWLHGGMLTYCTALPLSTHDYRLAANFMQFYVVRGISGINQFTQTVAPDFETGMQHLKIILTNGPQEISNYLKTENFDLNFLEKEHLTANEFFFPTNAPPVFLFLDTRLLGIQRWIHWYGNWNTKSQSGTVTLPTLVLKDVSFDSAGFPNDLRFSFNNQKGTFTLPGTFESPAKMANISIVNGNEMKRIDYDISPVNLTKYVFSKGTQRTIKSSKMLTDTGKYVAEFFPSKNQIILRDEQTSDALINHLFFRKNDPQTKYFEAIDILKSDYQIWKINGDH